MIETDLKRLEELAKQMEASELPLEKALELFQEGVELVKRCTKSIETAELKVKQILESSDGSFTEKPLG